VKVGIMQPYFMPYIGYFQLMNFCDKLVVYDNIQFTKKGWIKKNKYLCEGKEKVFSLQIKNDSSKLNIDERFLANSCMQQNKKILRSIESCYRKAPFFDQTFKVLQECFLSEQDNLFDFIFNSILVLADHMDINTHILKSSSIGANHQLKKQDRVIDLCLSMNAKTYINLSGGMELYSRDAFKDNNIDLIFMECINSKYDQNVDKFIERLSIIDMLMFVPMEEIKNLYLRDFKLI